MRGLSPVVASGGHSSWRCAGLSLPRPLLLRSTGSRRAGSVIVAHGPSCSAACGILPNQGLNPCPLHRQADSQPLRHQGSSLPSVFRIKTKLLIIWLPQVVLAWFLPTDLAPWSFTVFCSHTSFCSHSCILPMLPPTTQPLQRTVLSALPIPLCPNTSQSR